MWAPHLDNVGQGGDGDEVLRELHLGEVTRVLVRLVDDVGQKTLARNLEDVQETRQLNGPETRGLRR